MGLPIPKKTQPCYTGIVITLSVVTSLLFVVTLFFNFIGMVNDDIFNSDQATVSDEFELDITPAGFTFIIWGVIYIWQTAWIIYVLTSLCRRNRYGPVFTNPPIVTPFFLMVFCLNLWLNIMWLFLFDSKLFVWSLIDAFLMYLTLEICLISHHLAVDKYGKQLKKYQRRDLFAMRILIQNGLTLYRTWLVVATGINLGIVLTYVGNVSRSTSSTVGLAVVAFVIVLDFVLGVTIWDKYLRYTFSNYGVCIWALIGILVEHWDVNDRNSIIALILLFVCIIFVAVKLPLTVWRHRNRPLYVA